MFALFGKSYRKVNKGQLVNNINRKNCLVELEFSFNNEEYKIVRGINPNIFTIYKAGQALEKEAAMLDQQAWLEKNVIRMSYETFCQIVILGSANYIPFMKLTVPQRREVVENVFPLAIFSKMNELLKDRTAENTSRQLTLNSAINTNNTELGLQREYRTKIELLQTNQIDELQKEAKQLSVSVKTMQDAITVLRANNADEEQKLANLGPSKVVELEFEYRTVNSKIDQTEKELSRLTVEDICPTCGEKINALKRMKHQGEHKAELKKLQDKKQLLDEQIWNENTLEPLRKQHKQNITQNNEQILYKQMQIKQETERGIRLLNEIKQLKSQTGDIAKITQKINQLSEEIDRKQKELAEAVTESIVQKHCSELLKDKGIKAAVIKRYITQLNVFVAKYLELLNYSVGFELNENFEETIRSRNKDLFTYQSFSMGQRARIDLSLLFAWRDIAKLRSGIECNLLIFDEVFDSSLDGNGAGDLMMILEHFSDKNIVIISHRSEHVVDKIDRHLVIKMNNGFSTLEAA